MSHDLWYSDEFGCRLVIVVDRGDSSTDFAGVCDADRAGSEYCVRLLDLHPSKEAAERAYLPRLEELIRQADCDAETLRRETLQLRIRRNEIV